jgi:hypothetical protein
MLRQDDHAIHTRSSRPEIAIGVHEDRGYSLSECQFQVHDESTFRGIRRAHTSAIFPYNALNNREASPTLLQAGWPITQ